MDQDNKNMKWIRNKLSYIFISIGWWLCVGFDEDDQYGARYDSRKYDKEKFE